MIHTEHNFSYFFLIWFDFFFLWNFSANGTLTISLIKTGNFFYSFDSSLFYLFKYEHFDSLYSISNSQKSLININITIEIFLFLTWEPNTKVPSLLDVESRLREIFSSRKGQHENRCKRHLTIFFKVAS